MIQEMPSSEAFLRTNVHLANAASIGFLYYKNTSCLCWRIRDITYEHRRYSWLATRSDRTGWANYCNHIRVVGILDSTRLLDLQEVQKMTLLVTAQYYATLKDGSYCRKKTC